MASRLVQLANAARAVPPTPFRSADSPQLADALDAIVCRSFGVVPKAPDAVLEKEVLTPGQEGAVDAALKSLDSLTSASALKEFPISANLLHPQHDPFYYDRMREGVHRSTEGIARSWWKRFFQVRGKA